MQTESSLKGDPIDIPNSMGLLAAIRSLCISMVEPQGCGFIAKVPEPGWGLRVNPLLLRATSLTISYDELIRINWDLGVYQINEVAWIHTTAIGISNIELNVCPVRY